MRNDIRYVNHIIIVFLMFLFIFPLKANASFYKDQPIEIVGDDGEGGYIYRFGEGQFESNISDGDIVEIGYFKWDKNLSITLMKDGSQIPFESEDIIFTNGDYVAIIYDVNSGEIESIKFTVKNSMKTDISDDKPDGADVSDEDDVLDELEAMLGTKSMDGVASLSLKYEFDYDNLMFNYSAAGSSVYISDIPNNAISTEPVVVKSGSNSMTFAYKDGQVIFTPKDNKYSEPGFYDIVTYIYSSDDADIPEEERSVDTSIYMTHFVFTIIKPEDGKTGVINAPDGFKYVSIIKDGKELELPSSDYFFPERDGKYKFSFASKDDKSIVYELEYTRDTVAPFLTFNQKLKDSKGEPPLSYTVDDHEATVYVSSGDTSITMPEGKEINYTGWYKFKVVDKAGNERYYSVYMKPKVIFFSTGMKILLGALAFFIVAYLLTIRFSKYDVNG